MQIAEFMAVFASLPDKPRVHCMTVIMAWVKEAISAGAIARAELLSGMCVPLVQDDYKRG